MKSSFFDIDHIKKETSALMLLVSGDLLSAYDEVCSEGSRQIEFLKSAKSQSFTDTSNPHHPYNLFVFDDEVDIKMLCLEATARHFSTLFRDHPEQTESIKDLAVFLLKDKYKSAWLYCGKKETHEKRLQELLSERNTYAKDWGRAGSKTTEEKVAGEKIVSVASAIERFIKENAVSAEVIEKKLNEFLEKISSDLEKVLAIQNSAFKENISVTIATTPQSDTLENNSSGSVELVSFGNIQNHTPSIGVGVLRDSQEKRKEEAGPTKENAWPARGSNP